MIPHPVAAWARENGLSRSDVYRRYASACRRRRITPRAKGTIRNAVDGRKKLSSNAVLALAEATGGAVTVEQILEFQNAIDALAPREP